MSTANSMTISHPPVFKFLFVQVLFPPHKIADRLQLFGRHPRYPQGRGEIIPEQLVGGTLAVILHLFSVYIRCGVKENKALRCVDCKQSLTTLLFPLPVFRML